MDQENYTLLTEVIFLGLSTNLSINLSLFVICFHIYLITVTGNVLIIFIIASKHQLHTPMYFFLCILSFLDLFYSTTVIPRLLSDLLSVQRSISLIACKIQFYNTILLVGTESLLLAIMAYDRYVAICRPLHYPILMRWSVCYRMTATLFISSFLTILLPSLAFPISLCNPNQVNHFMCEGLSLTKLRCNHRYSVESLTLAICFLDILLPFLFILGTYSCILSSVLKIHSLRRSKAFSTCTSHVTVVVLFYGMIMILYFGATADYSTNQGKYMSLFHVILCPLLNPIIYSFSNADFKETLKKKKCSVFFLVNH